MAVAVKDNGILNSRQVCASDSLERSEVIQLNADIKKGMDSSLSNMLPKDFFKQLQDLL